MPLNSKTHHFPPQLPHLPNTSSHGVQPKVPLQVGHYNLVKGAKSSFDISKTYATRSSSHGGPFFCRPSLTIKIINSSPKNSPFSIRNSSIRSIFLPPFCLFNKTHKTISKNMAQKRDKDETLDLQVPATTGDSLSCFKIQPKPTSNPPITTQITSSGSGSDPEKMDQVSGSGRERRGSDGKKADGEIPARKTVNRCSGCRKRVGLTGFRCRCGEMFCWEHRYSDRHDCSFDYKAAGRAAIARENPVVRAAKLLKV